MQVSCTRATRALPDRRRPASSSPRLFTQRICAELAQWLAPLIEYGVERAAARLVADEAVLVAKLEIVAVDLDARQPFAAVRN